MRVSKFIHLLATSALLLAAPVLAQQTAAPATTPAQPAAAPAQAVKTPVAAPLVGAAPPAAGLLVRARFEVERKAGS